MGLDLKDIEKLGPTARRQIAEKLISKNRKDATDKQRKYHNTPTQRVMPGGRIRTFDSKKEAERFDELMAMLRAGEIDDLRIQPHFTLSEAWVTCEGVPVRAMQYVADFSYRKVTGFKVNGDISSQNLLGALVVEDCKGGNATKTAEYNMKKKLMQNRFGITIKEV